MNLAEFFAMGGYGFYVWGAYGLTIVLVAIEIAAVRMRLRAARTHAQPGENTR